MQYQRLIGSALLMGAFLALPSMEAWGQKDKKSEDSSAKPTDSDAIPAGEYMGILKSTPGTDRNFTVDLEVPKLVPTIRVVGGSSGGGSASIQSILRNQARLQQAQLQFATAPTPFLKAQAASRIRNLTGVLQRSIANLRRGPTGPRMVPGYRIERSIVTIEFQASEKAKVRTMLLPETFDDKGNLKKYSKKELAELKGKDKGLPGFEGALDKLEVGQVVRVLTAAVGKSAATKSAKDKDKDDDDELDEKSKQAKLIVVLGVAPDRSMGTGKRKTK
jgi:hypothetical protein